MLRMLKRKRILVPLLAAVGLLAVAGGAFAYFTSTGSGTGTGTVGSASPWSVAVAAPTGGPLYPNAGSEAFSYTVTNASAGNQQLSGTTATVVAYSGSIAADAGDVVTSGGTPVAGCLASWFTAANTSPSAGDLAGGASKTGSVTLTMQDSTQSQNACQGAAPQISVAAS